MSTMSEAYLFSFVNTCASLGVPKDDLLAFIPDAQNATKCQDEGQNIRRYPVEHLYQVLAKAEEITNKPEIGLLCGKHIRPASLRDLGHALLCCDTLRQVILINIRYQPLTQQLGRSDLAIEGQQVYLKWVPGFENPEYSRRITDAVMAGHAAFGRWLSWAHDKKINAVHFRHAKPSYWKHYVDIFNCPVFFGQQDNALVFDLEAIDAPLPQANANVLAEICTRLDIELAKLEHTGLFHELVTKVLHLGGRLGPFDLTQTAQRLGVSTRSLRRSLAAENTNFRTLLEQVRRDKCEVLLANNMPLSEIAEKLGYSQQSAFNRAFKSWYGITPKAYKKRQEIAGVLFEQLAP